MPVNLRSGSQWLGARRGGLGGYGGAGDPGVPPVPPLLTDLAAYWTLDEASGTREDSVGVSDLTDVNTVTSTTGKQGSAGQFTAASSEKLTVADNAAVQTGDIDFTIAGWFYADTLTGNRALFGKDVDTTSRDYRLDINAAATGVRFIVFDSSGGVVGIKETGVALSTSTWYFVVAWHDATANTVNVQVNDGTVFSAATTGAVGTSAASFQIGDFGNTGTVYWDGRIDEVGLWKRVLTADERTALYAGGIGMTYPFDAAWPQRVLFGAAGNLAVDTTTWFTKTVPPGVTWRIIGLDVLAERFGDLPEGGELRSQVQADLVGDGSYVIVAESTLETGNRVAYQSLGPFNLTLTPGQHLRGQTLRNAADTAYFGLVSAIVEVSPL